MNKCQYSDMLSVLGILFAISKDANTIRCDYSRLRYKVNDLCDGDSFVIHDEYGTHAYKIGENCLTTVNNGQ